jgi:tRNA-uridine 2-sulfurtransferase
MKIYVGLSGGVDSAVTAALLQQQGHEITGVYMKNWTQDLPGAKCPWQQDLADARAVATHLDIPFKVYDFENEYRHKVVDYMVTEYRAGRTPNPDVMCNQEIKFKLFLEAALADGAEAIATGHYASVRDGRLYRGVDDNKDQTYFLYRITEKALVKSVMPIGEYTKPQVRAMAAKLNLPNATKKDSQGICFVGPVGMKVFLQQYVNTGRGEVLDLKGHKLGQHDGAIFFTIGQRSGLGIGGPKGPYFVVGKDMDKNEVYVTNNVSDLTLKNSQLNINDLHWINKPPVGDRKYSIRFRHRGELEKCRVEFSEMGLKLNLDKPVHAVAPGQSAVIYDGRQVIGGGIVSVKTPIRPNHIITK